MVALELRGPSAATAAVAAAVPVVAKLADVPPAVRRVAQAGGLEPLLAAPFSLLGSPVTWLELGAFVLAVTVAITSTPNQSSCLRPAASTPRTLSNLNTFRNPTAGNFDLQGVPAPRANLVVDSINAESIFNAGASAMESKRCFSSRSTEWADRSQDGER